MNNIDKEISNKNRKNRIRIANLIARNKGIDRRCNICNKKQGRIIHNKENPYFIAFICDECSKDKNNIRKAAEKRRDIRKELNKISHNVEYFTDIQIRNIIVNYMNSNISIKEYCDRMRLSRYQFNKIVERYNKIFPNQGIEELVKKHYKQIQSVKVKQMVVERELKKKNRKKGQEE